MKRYGFDEENKNLEKELKIGFGISIPLGVVFGVVSFLATQMILLSLIIGIFTICIGGVWIAIIILIYEVVYAELLDIFKILLDMSKILLDIFSSK